MKQWIRNRSFLIPSLILGLFFGLMIPVGKALGFDSSFRIIVLNPAQTLKSLLLAFGYGFLFFCIIFLFFFVLDLWRKRIPSHKTTFNPPSSSFFLNHRFLVFGILFLILLLCFIPFYPGTVMGDTPFQIREAFGIPASYTSQVSPFAYQYPDTTLSTMHPPLHTLLLKLCLNIGHSVFGSYNAGLAIVVVLQLLLVSFGLSRACYVFATFRVRNSVILLFLLFFFVNPIFWDYNYLLSKDVFYSGFLQVFLIELFLIIKKRSLIRDWILFSVSAVGLAAFRGEGFLLVAIACASVLLFELIRWIRTRKKKDSGRRKKKQPHIKWIAVVGASIIVLHIIWGSVMLPLLHVTPSAKAIQANIPVQQVISYLIKHGDNALTEEEFDAVSKVVFVSKAKRLFNPHNADPAKECIDYNASDEDFKSFLKVWNRIILRDPSHAFISWFNTKHGYFYPDAGVIRLYKKGFSQEQMKELNKEIGETVKDLHFQYPHDLRKLGRSVQTFLVFAEQLPVLRTLFTPVFYTGLLAILTFFFIRRRSKEGCILLSPLLFIFLIICMFSAVNGYYGRYMYPILMTMPGILILGIRNCRPETEAAKKKISDDKS